MSNTDISRLGGLKLDDFMLLDPATLDRVLEQTDPETLRAAFRMRLDLLARLVRRRPALRRQLLDAPPTIPHDTETPPPGENDARSQESLVHRHAYELLMAKSPALYETLPWLDWDFGIVSSRFRLWRTRFLLAGDGTSITVTRCRRTAGITVVEPRPDMARYIERKAELARVRHVAVRQDTLTGGHLAAETYDLAIVAVPLTEDIDRVLPMVEEVAGTILLLALRSDPPAILEGLLTRRGYRPESVRVAGSAAQRPCWWWTRQS